ncbi:MAG TPA: DinB family protein [Anaerolineales bacterium]|nr:DinB family protein [Anaerolineales bacterium]
MQKQDLLFLLDYGFWANHKLFEAARRLKAGQFTAPYQTTYGSLRGILEHILVSYLVWHSRCQEGRTPTDLPTPADFPDLESFITRFEQEQAALRAYIAALNDAEVQRGVSYTTSKGQTHTHALWQIIAHVVNHATQHRSEAAELLTQCGSSPGDLDVIWYLRQKISNPKE